MAIPRVFVSSTWYDLRYIRENLKYLIKTVGYDPVLNEDGNIFYNPSVNVQDACVTELPNCQMLILIIGGRFGASFHGSDMSITNHEYIEACNLKIPVFALVEYSVLNDFYLFQANEKNELIDANNINYPSADSTRIFEFIRMVQGSLTNNALVPFRDFADIEAYLRQQWAGMMYSFLVKQNEQDRVNDTLEMLTTISSRVEMLSGQILESVGTKSAKLTAALYDAMLQYELVRDLVYIGSSPTPGTLLVSENFDECFLKSGGKTLNVDDDRTGSVIGPNGYMSFGRYERDAADFPRLKADLEKILADHGVSIDEYLKEAPVASTSSNISTPRSGNRATKTKK